MLGRMNKISLHKCHDRKKIRAVINNQDNAVTSVYVYTDLHSDGQKKHFMGCSELREDQTE